MKNTFDLWYHCSDNGDGSVSVHFHQNEEQAVAADEEMEQGWGENSAGNVTLKVEDNKLYFESHEFIDGKYTSIWNMVE